MLYLMFNGIIKVIFVVQVVSGMIFKGGILGGMHHFWGDHYLSSTVDPQLFNPRLSVPSFTRN